MDPVITTTTLLLILVPWEAMGACYQSPGTTVFHGNDLVCQSSVCSETASYLLKHMKPDVNPCEDFYEFVCGNYHKDTPLPRDVNKLSMFEDIQNDVNKQLRKLLEEPIRSTDLKPFVLAKKLYSMCINEHAIDAIGMEPLLKIINENGGWPVLEGDNWQENDASLTNFTIISVDVGIDYGNTTNHNIYVKYDLDEHLLSKGYNNNTYLEEYYKLMIDIAAMFGANKETAKKELMEVMKLLIELVKIVISSSHKQESVYNPTSIKEMQEKYPTIPWLNLIKSRMPSSLNISISEIINIENPEFFMLFEKLHPKISTRTWANLRAWNTIIPYIPYLPYDIRKRCLDIIYLSSEEIPRWKQCIDTVNKNLHIPLGALYARNDFVSDQLKNEVVELIGNLQSSFVNILEQAEWMDDTTKLKAIEKVSAMQHLITYPNEYFDDNLLTKMYDDLKIYEDMYLESVFSIIQYKNNMLKLRLRKTVNKVDWISSSLSEVDAFYVPLKNIMVLTASILKGQLFSEDRPKYINYGRIGYIVGHEVTHGFDDQGRQLDRNGNLNDWWEPATKDIFLEKTRCIQYQYGNYTMPELNMTINGLQTLSENIADNGGIKEAYLAYSKWVENNKPEPRLPGLNYSPQQMFWISSASVWCAKYQPQFLRNLILTDPHSPGRYRVNGVMRNSPMFARDFQCPLGSPMNPVDKCEVW